MSRTAWIAGILVVAGVWSQFHLLEGAALATYDQLRGHRRLYQLGCVLGPSHPTQPIDFRYEELLRQRYSLYFEGVGGFAPPDSTVDFVKGYDWAAWQWMRKRFGAGFLERTYDEASRDVVVRTVTMLGCIAEHQLELASGEKINLWTVSEADLGRYRDVPVVVTGKLTEVRKGAWNEQIGRRLEAQAIAADSSGQCAQRE